MALKGFLELGSGKALCQICEEKIKKGVPQISHRGNRCSVSFHANAKDCGIPRSVKSIKQRSCNRCNQDGGRIQRSDRYPPYKIKTVCGNCYGEFEEKGAETQDMMCCGEYMEFYDDYFYCPICESSIETKEFDAESTVKTYGMVGAGAIAILALLTHLKK